MVNEIGVAELLIQATDWARLREANGTAEDVGVALLELLGSSTPDAGREVYWRIENHVFIQGELFEVAEACTAVLVAVFANERPRHVRIAALDLLFLILNGGSSPAPGTPQDLPKRCRQAVMEGLWCIVREAISGERDAAWDVLDLVAVGRRRNSILSVVARGRTLLESRSL
jgi:hypothetical protein